MAKVLNSLLSTIMIFLLTFTWAYYCIKNVTWALALLAIVSVCACYLLWKSLSKWDDGKRLKKQQKKAISDFAEYLKFGEDNASLFEDMLKYYGFEVFKTDYDSLDAVKNGVKSYAVIHFEQDALSKDALRNAVVDAKRRKAEKLYVFTCKADQPLQTLANAHIPTSFIDAKNTYQLFEQCDKLPAVKIKSRAKSSFVAKYALCKQRFGWYLGSCLFLTAVSIVSYFPWYTLAWATVMFALALYSLLNKKYNIIETRVKLD